MNLRKNQKGFTIVELLIVVVVIAILAAISIVAYTGITNRANRSAAMDSAASVQSVALAYQGANSSYPTTKALFVSGGADPLARLPSDITFVTAAITAAPANPKTVQVIPYPSATAPYSGFRIYYWDYISGAAAYMDAGLTTSTTATTGLAN